MNRLHFSQKVFWGTLITCLILGFLWLKGNIYYDIVGLDIPVNVEDYKVVEGKNFLIAIIVSVVLALICSVIGLVNRLCSYLEDAIKRFFRWIVSNKKKIILNIVILAVIGFVSIGLNVAFEHLKGIDSFNPYRVMIIFAVLTILYYAYKCRKDVHLYMHKYFFLIIMLVGTIHILVAPPMVGMSWDDEIHYGRTSYMSWELTAQVSEADNAMIGNYVETIQQHFGYTEEDRATWKEEINQYDDYYTLVETPAYRLSERYIAYIPSAIALAVGRGIGLSYTATFMFGKWISLLCYAIVMSLSIKLLKGRGKTLVATMAFVPTMLFMASSYSYDWWVYSFIILGYSLVIGTIQDGRKISFRRMIITLAILFFGMMPKAIYFPLILPLLLLKKDHLEKPTKSRVFIILATLLVMATFLLPMFVNGAGQGDLRGGSAVNSTEQIKFILANVPTYIKILGRFLAGYLSSDASYGYLTLMAYYGQAKYFTVCIIAIVIAAVIDNRQYDKAEDLGKSVKIGTVLAAFVAIALSATALYISFTAVASDTILGCQARYILPVLFPFLYVVGEMKLEASQKIKNNAFMLCTTMMAFVFLYGIYDLVVAIY